MPIVPAATATHPLECRTQVLPKYTATYRNTPPIAEKGDATPCCGEGQ